MKISEIATLLKANIITDTNLDMDRDISTAYCCDMLSLVMKNAQANMALITIQTNMNVVAVCVLMESPLVIITEGIHIEQKSLEKANAENIVILETEYSSYEASGLLYSQGIPSVSIK